MGRRYNPFSNILKIICLLISNNQTIWTLISVINPIKLQQFNKSSISIIIILFKLGWKIRNILIVQITWTAVKAATKAGLPNPWDMSEKCVKCLCIFGSNSRGGLVLHNGDLSLFSNCTNSVIMTLQYIRKNGKAWKSKTIKEKNALYMIKEEAHFVEWISSLRLYELAGSLVCCLVKYSATWRAGNSVSQTYPKSLAKWIASPVTRRKKKKKKNRTISTIDKIGIEVSQVDVQSVPETMYF